MPGGVGRPSWWAGRGQEFLPEGREALSEVWDVLLEGREGSRGPPGET